MDTVSCSFCNHAVRLPAGSDALQQVLKCIGCHASYWLMMHDDISEVIYGAAEHFGVPEQQAQDQVEYDIVREIDRLLAYQEQPTEEGIELCLVFVRRK